jgi:ribosomal-protein-alanine N-acetyltransferase
MVNGSNVNIEGIVGQNNGYIIKDKVGITIGRINIIELSKSNKYCLLRIKFYKEIYLKESLMLFTSYLFKDLDIYKVNYIADEEINTSPFVELGFMLEGILTDCNIKNNVRKSEIVFGINQDIYSNIGRINILRYKGNKIEIKILTVEDSFDMLQYYKRNKKHLQKFEPTREDNFYTIEAQRKILMESYKQFLNGLSANFGIYNEKGLIGKIQISGIIYGVFRSGIVGYSMDASEQGKGYMKEALNMVLDYGFNELELHRIEASTLVDNLRSQNVLKGCNFIELGINKNYLLINGKWRDHITFYKIKD